MEAVSYVHSLFRARPDLLRLYTAACKQVTLDPEEALAKINKAAASKMSLGEYKFHELVLSVPVRVRKIIVGMEYRQGDDSPVMVLLSLLRHFQLHGEEKIGAWLAASRHELPPQNEVYGKLVVVGSWGRFVQLVKRADPRLFPRLASSLRLFARRNHDSLTPPCNGVLVNLRQSLFGVPGGHETNHRQWLDAVDRATLKRLKAKVSVLDRVPDLSGECLAGALKAAKSVAVSDCLTRSKKRHRTQLRRAAWRVECNIE